jgi:hypothetical protein
LKWGPARASVLVAQRVKRQRVRVARQQVWVARVAKWEEPQRVRVVVAEAEAK